MQVAVPGSRLVRTPPVIAMVTGAPQRLSLFAAAVLLAVGMPCGAKPFTIASPNGKVAATISDAGGVVSYTVSLDGSQVLAPSTVRIQSDGLILGKEARFGKARGAPAESKEKT